MGIWATLCGALASNRLRWESDHLLTLALVLLLSDLAWGSLWDLSAGTNWRLLLTPRASPALSVSRFSIPYTLPSSPGGKLFRAANRLAAWWRGVFWPSAGSRVLGMVAAAVLALVLTSLLPDRIAPLYPMLVLLICLGAVFHWWGRVPLGGQALVLVGLSWLAGNASFSEIGLSSIVLALSFSAVTWGIFRATESRPAGLWLWNGGLILVAALLLYWGQPLAGGAVGLLLLGQVAIQFSLRLDVDPSRIVRRAWPWFMLAMLLAAIAVP
jgi:hypothetical protein